MAPACAAPVTIDPAITNMAATVARERFTVRRYLERHHRQPRFHNEDSTASVEQCP